MFLLYSKAIGFKTSPRTLIVFGFFGTNIVSPSSKIVLVEDNDWGEKLPAILTALNEYLNS